ncbi:MAG: hypothetical protein K2Y51_13915 [Gammaproteobacteria bacterium]|nr:hypothetical protein [Gammaproteobacteria bacterium]
MHRVLAFLLALVAGGSFAAEPTQPPADGAATTEAPGVAPTKEALKQGFDGAMTCSAVCALAAQGAGKDTAWLWRNRSFAFGMLAAQFYSQASNGQVSREDLDSMLTEYANALQTMSPEARKPFDDGCARKYAAVDQLCKENGCPNAAPAAPEFVAPGEAAAPAAPSQQ